MYAVVAFSASHVFAADAEFLIKDRTTARLLPSDKTRTSISIQAQPYDRQLGFSCDAVASSSAQTAGNIRLTIASDYAGVTVDQGQTVEGVSSLATPELKSIIPANVGGRISLSLLTSNATINGLTCRIAVY